MSHAYFVFQLAAYPMPKDWAYKVSALMKEVHDPVYGDITQSGRTQPVFNPAICARSHRRSSSRKNCVARMVKNP